MNLISGYPYSLVRYGLPFNYPKLKKDTRTDVLIIGGGISGALMAWYLLKEGISCMLIDGRTIGLGSSSASTSLLQYEIDVPLVELQKKIGLQPAVTAYKLCADAIDKLAILAKQLGLKDFETKQSLYYAKRKKDDAFLKEEFEIRQAHGFDVQLLDEKEVKDSFNFKASSAILSQKAAATNAYTFTHALLQACVKQGMEIYDRTKAIEITHSKDGVIIRTENGHCIRAGKLIYANGYEASDYIDQKIVDLRSTYAVCSEQMEEGSTPFNPGILLWNTADPYLYMRTTSDNRVLVGGRDEKFYNPVKRDKLIAKKTRQLKDDIMAMFPESEFKPEFSWVGTFGSTKDGLPYIGPYRKLDNSYFALGFGGNGITFSLIAAEILSKELKRDTGIDKMFSFDR